MTRCPACGKKATTDTGLLRESPQTDASNVVERNHNFVAAEVNHNASPRVFTAFNVKFVKTFWTKLVSLCPQIGGKKCEFKQLFNAMIQKRHFTVFIR